MSDVVASIAGMIVDPVRYSLPIPKAIRTADGVVIIGTTPVDIAVNVLRFNEVAGCIFYDKDQIVGLERIGNDYKFICSIGIGED